MTDTAVGDYRLDGHSLVGDRHRVRPTETPCADGQCETPAVAAGLCPDHIRTRITTCGVIRRRARTLLDLIDTDLDLADPDVLEIWVRSVQDAAYNLHKTLE